MSLLIILKGHEKTVTGYFAADAKNCKSFQPANRPISGCVSFFGRRESTK